MYGLVVHTRAQVQPLLGEAPRGFACSRAAVSLRLTLASYDAKVMINVNTLAHTTLHRTVTRAHSSVSVACGRRKK